MQNHLFPSFGILMIGNGTTPYGNVAATLANQADINHLYHCHDGHHAIEIISSHSIGLVLLDLSLPLESGKDLLKQINRQFPEVRILVIGDMHQLEAAVHCVQLGAFDYIIKTPEESQLIDAIHRAVALLEMTRNNHIRVSERLRESLKHPAAFQKILTQNGQMMAIFQYLESVSVSNQPVLITGESGVGKELIANAIHSVSQREGPIVCLNVAGLDDNVFADTLFGHKKGAFTGAGSDRAGLIEQAAGGTLFLDEIGDLSPTSQIKLLRLLQEGEFFPLGSDTPRYCQARIIAATHQDLAARLESRQFRTDLYYRLRTHQVDIPPLRLRKDDIPLLFRHYVKEAAENMSKPAPRIPRELLVLLANYHFPGNVRELRALAYDAVSRHKSKVLSMKSFRHLVDGKAPANHLSFLDNKIHFNPEQPLPSLQEVGDLLVLEAMHRTEGNQTLASRMLGISQPALSKRLKKVNKLRWMNPCTSDTSLNQAM
ncbi:sigma-54-dependent transcriptional regulator [Hahella ganghwensis]|uniref:sigma-54-dependent transcriptional regulator n=1 Tax=Hahella ganghwensis TaxID=286420 RepID=UPI00037F6672|nr:sigma-54 dependent transcriptional regulator [Hahella ganghwensis]